MREQRQWQPKHAVSPHLEHHTGQQHGTASGRLNVSVGQPSVERHRRQFHQETNHQHDEEDLLQAFAKEPFARSVGDLSVGDQGWNVESSTRPLTGVRQALGLKEVHGDEAKQHDDRGREGVDEELLRSVFSVFSTPLQDEEKHGNQRQFPEDVEHEEVKGDEHTDEGPAHQQNQREIGRGVFLVPGSHDGDGQQKGGQPHHGEGQRVHADGPVDAERFDPIVPFVVVQIRKTETGPIVHVANEVRSHEHGRRERQHDQRNHEGNEANVATDVFLCGGRKASHKGQQDKAAEDGQRHQRQGNPVRRQATNPHIIEKSASVPTAAIRM